MNPSTHYDVLIVGAGVTGTALLYELARFTDVGRIGLLEKYPSVAMVNSHAHSNSQTLHCGDIETTYGLEKARVAKRTAHMVVNYATKLPARDRDRIIYRMPKMVLGVGRRECDYIRQRHQTLAPLFPRLRLLERRDIANVEPNVALVEGAWRKEEIVASGTLDDYCAVDFHELAESFSRACVRLDRQQGRQITQLFNTQVDAIQRDGDHYVLTTSRGPLLARALVVCAGGYSLPMAQRMGLGLEYACLPVTGSFYFVPEALNGKVYTVQSSGLPFTAVHGDHDIKERGKTRFGPTAIMLPRLERRGPASLRQFLDVLRFDRRVAGVLRDQLRATDFRRFILRNLMYEAPLLNRHLFAREIRKIVPSISVSDISYAEGFGGVRPQLVDKRNGEFRMGEAKLGDGAGLFFNVTPSPGGTCCLASGETDMRALARYLGARIDEHAFEQELLTGHEDTRGDRDLTAPPVPLAEAG